MPATNISENNLVSRIKKSDMLAYNTFFNQYYKSICVYINSYILDFETSRDLAQDIFYKLWNNREHFPEVDKYEAYLFKIAKNKALDYLKSKKVQSKYADFILKHHNESVSEADALEVEEIKQIMKSELGQLSDITQKIYELKSKKSLTSKNISETLSIPKKTIDWHVSKINGLIKKIINNYIQS